MLGKSVMNLRFLRLKRNMKKFNQMRISKVDQDDGDFEKTIKLIKVKIESEKK